MPRQGGRCPIFQTGRRAGGPVSILRSAVLLTTNSTGAGKEHKMSKAADISEPASELEHLMADLSGLGPLVFVFGDDFAVTHLLGAITPVFSGHADERWWYVEVGDDAAKWTIHVRVDQITGVRFERGPYPYPSFPGQEGLGVQFLGPDKDKIFGCGVPHLYHGQQMRPEKLEAWQTLRERYGNRDESRVDRGTLLAPAA